MSNKADSGKHYHRECSGAARTTALAHEKDEDITLFGSCFCPFVQRVWVAFEALGIPYQYYEVDPYQKPQDLLEVSPKGLVPGLKLHKYNPPRALNESTVIMDYLEDLAAMTTQRSLYPPASNPYARALVRLQSDHVSRTLVPAFYRFLQAQAPADQIAGGKELLDALEGLCALFTRAEGEGEQDALGLWSEEEGARLGWTDVFVGPWLFRATNVLKHYRGFELSPSTKFRAYLQRLFEYPAFKATCSNEDLYLESYERYAYNRPNTSQVANAINQGRGLP